MPDVVPDRDADRPAPGDGAERSFVGTPAPGSREPRAPKVSYARASDLGAVEREACGGCIGAASADEKEAQRNLRRIQDWVERP